MLLFSSPTNEDLPEKLRPFSISGKLSSDTNEQQTGNSELLKVVIQLVPMDDYSAGGATIKANDMST